MKKILTLVVSIIALVAIYYLEQPTAQIQDSQTQLQSDITVIDGDTIELADGEKIRLIGINAPESDQPYGKEAKNHLLNLIRNHSISITLDQEKKDRYGRTLAYVYADDTFVNEQMVSGGLALTEIIPPNDKHESTFLEAEKSAQSECKGIWEGRCVKGVSSECIRIPEINYDAPGDDGENPNGEWIALENICLEDIPLDGYLLKDRSASNSYFFKNKTLPASTIVRLHSGCGDDTATSWYWQCPDPSSGIWNNTGDHAYLFGVDGVLVTDNGY